MVPASGLRRCSAARRRGRARSGGAEHQYEDKSDSDICNDIALMVGIIFRSSLNGLKREDLIVIDAHLGAVCTILEGKQQ
jgi:hypothetical protein